MRYITRATSTSGAGTPARTRRGSRSDIGVVKANSSTPRDAAEVRSSNSPARSGPSGAGERTRPARPPAPAAGVPR
ncbi:hypothetical protein SHIRM173S_10509 [Streptomyces hirsutus]